MRDAVSLVSRPRVRKDVLFRDLDGELVLLDLASGVYFGLDPVGTRVWHLIEREEPLGAIVDALVTEYEVAETECARDVVDLVTLLVKNGLVEVPERAIP